MPQEQETEPTPETAPPADEEAAEGQESPATGADEAPAIDLDWLLEADTEEEAGAPSTDGRESEPQAEAAPRPDGEEAVTYSHLPDWLQGDEEATKQKEPELDDEVDWDDDLDFTDLPGWDADEIGEDGSQPDGDGHLSEPTEYLPWEDPIQSPESEGSGLLAGVRSPIPVEPVITISHEAPPFPSQPSRQQDDEAVNLFSRIAGGAVVPDPIARPEAPPRLVGLLHLLLLLIVVATLLLNPQIFGLPPESQSVLAFGQAIEALPEDSTVLIAFDFEGGMADELMPGTIATLNRIRTLPEEAGGDRENIRLVAVSTSPHGPMLARSAWRASKGRALEWQNLGYLPGGSIGLRTLFTERLQESPQATGGMDNLSMIIVVGNQTLEIQRWIEQVGAQRPQVPMVAIAPAISETTLMPYMASGQLDGLLAGLPGAVSYEAHFIQEGGIAWRRIDAMSLAASFILVVIVIGNLVAVKRHLQRRRNQQAEYSPSTSA